MEFGRVDTGKHNANSKLFDAYEATAAKVEAVVGLVSTIGGGWDSAVSPLELHRVSRVAKEASRLSVVMAFGGRGTSRIFLSDIPAGRGTFTRTTATESRPCQQLASSNRQLFSLV